MAAPLVAIDDVVKRFGAVTALNGVSAEIRPGEITGLVGPDGAGKTTLIRLMTGLMRPNAGDLRIAGLSTTDHAPEIQQRIGYMPQKFGLYGDLSVSENLTLYADLRNVIGFDRKRTFDRLYDFTGLAPFKARLASALSGGMKQKLGLACALILRPELLLLDEPSVGVDPISRRELWRMVGALTDDGVGVIWATAYLDEAEQCARVLLLNEGDLVFSGRPQDLTSEISGRAFRLSHAGDNRRATLAKILELPGVIDGVIQGRFIRIVTDERVGMDQLRSKIGAVDLGGELEEAPPRFEDAFVARLGGGPGGRSRLAENTTPRPIREDDVITADNLTKRFGAFTAADNVSFKIKQGEVFGFLGPNGAGKSTTFKMLCGLLQPTKGRASVVGVNLKTSASEARARIGYMAQKFSLYGQLSARQNLEFFSSVYGLRGRQRFAKLQEMVDIFSLKDVLDMSTDDLPLGFKQRLALACAVMHGPDVLFLDEPTSGVDPITRREFWTHINGLVDKGVAIMVTTHFMDEAEYCDRIALIYHGRVIATGAPDDLKSSVQSADLPNPSMEDAFIRLVERADGAEAAA